MAQGSGVSANSFELHLPGMSVLGDCSSSEVVGHIKTAGLAFKPDSLRRIKLRAGGEEAWQSLAAYPSVVAELDLAGIRSRSYRQVPDEEVSQRTGPRGPGSGNAAGSVSARKRSYLLDDVGKWGLYLVISFLMIMGSDFIAMPLFPVLMIFGNSEQETFLLAKLLFAFLPSIVLSVRAGYLFCRAKGIHVGFAVFSLLCWGWLVLLPIGLYLGRDQKS